MSKMREANWFVGTGPKPFRGVRDPLGDQAVQESLGQAGKLPRRLRILMILHMPWCRDLGGPRASMEIADELRGLGHVVEKYDIDDALPWRPRIVACFAMALFAWRACKYVRRHGQEFDVIQAEQGNLPCSKRRLRFHGTLIARSSGLLHHHIESAHRLSQARMGRHRGRVLGRIMRSLAGATWGIRQVNRSFQEADLITLLNEDELAFVCSQLRLTGKAMVLHNGLSQQRSVELSSANAGCAARLWGQRIVFIGVWVEGKGSADFPRLVNMVRSAEPRSRFVLLGTGKTSVEVLRAFAAADRPYVEVIPRFQPHDLPSLLADATVGVFPSYMEGFGIAVLEKLAAGLPVVAYDVPGPREMLRHIGGQLMVPPGDVNAMAAKVIEILRFPLETYSGYSEAAVKVAERFKWPEIAAKFIDAVQSAHVP